MKKLTRDLLKRRDEIVKRLSETASRVEAAQSALVAALEAHNAALEQAEELRLDVCGDMEQWVSEKSERWQESEAGQQYDAWMLAWDEKSFKAVEPPDLDMPDAAEVLEALPSSPDEV